LPPSHLPKFVAVHESVPGPKLPMCSGQSVSALPRISDVHLFSYRKRVIDLNAEVSDGAFDFSVTE
jgi:hypothetical protein